MRTIRRTVQFKRDYKREKRGQYRTTLDDELLTVVQLLTIDAKLPELMHDHALIGNYPLTTSKKKFILNQV
jgi:mRNA interferase YafQ